MAGILSVEVEKIKEEDCFTTINNHEDYSGNYSASNNYFYNIPEFIMKNQQDYIEMLKEEIIRLKEENRRLTESGFANRQPKNFP
jgi:FtsZ-binding cell division protein ZapB